KRLLNLVPFGTDPFSSTGSQLFLNSEGYVNMKRISQLFMLSFCLVCMQVNISYAATNQEDETSEEVQKGSNNGRLLIDGDFMVELAIFETGVPPEFRVWTSMNGQLIPPGQVKLKVVLTRLGNIKDNINFFSENDFLRGDMEIYEPHSFQVSLTAQYQGVMYTWQYDNFEGRTEIESKVADALAIGILTAGSQTLKETLQVYGRLANKPENIRNISARFDGEIKSMYVTLGQPVKKGQRLMSVESNESLRSYVINSPINGVVQSINVNPGEQTNAKLLMEIVDNSTLFAELSVFPTDRERITIGANVNIDVKGHDGPLNGEIMQVNEFVEPNQSVIVRVEVGNDEEMLASGSFVTADIQVAEYVVDLAVKQTGLQTFRDFTVVYEKIGNEYEVRMLELGRRAGQWVEVLGGLKSGAKYVSENSYVIKADIEKSGASHDH
ncbi:Probable Co/Zn/Cd efflux system membrane fusion protein, partial [hydrothermal vent metagenome]